MLWRTTDQEGHAIRQRLGWLDSLTTFRSKVDEIRRFATEVKDQGYSHVVLLGMGGSSLWPQVCRATFGAAPGWPHLLVLDNTDPSAIREVASQIHLLTTLFLVASKSGTTIETLSFYRYFRALIGQQAPDHVGDHFVAITDAGTPLAEEAQHYRFRRCFETPEDIGGRYAALSYFGLVPMALLGIDIAALLERAHQMQVSCGPFVPAATNPGLSLGTLLGMAARHGRNKVTFVLAEPIGTFGDEHPVVEENGMAIYRAGAPGNHRTVHNALKAFVDAGLETVAAPDYPAFLPYWRYTPERHEMLQNLRLALRNRCKVATTLGYGPRYLHATGQLHKGGPYTAVLLMLTADAPEDLPIPGEPFGFATLQRAQALA